MLKRKKKKALKIIAPTSRTEEWADFASILYEVEARSGKPHSKRIERLIELLSTLGEPSVNLKKMETFAELHHILSRYQWTRTVEPSGNGLVIVTWPTIQKLSEDDAWECQVAAALLNFAALPDGASRIRRCEIENCKTWFYASGRKDQRWCSGKCRQRAYDNDPARKNQHRANMRRLYKQEKERAESAKRTVGFSNGAKKMR